MAFNKTPTLEKHRTHESDTGSTTVQIAVLTERINYLTEHFRTHSRDHLSRQGLYRLIGKRKRLLKYMRTSDLEGYRKLVQDLGLRY
jgi:small subunit ribosomal protein S15